MVTAAAAVGARPMRRHSWPCAAAALQLCICSLFGAVGVTGALEGGATDSAGECEATAAGNPIARPKDMQMDVWPAGVTMADPVGRAATLGLYILKLLV